MLCSFFLGGTAEAAVELLHFRDWWVFSGERSRSMQSVSLSLWSAWRCFRVVSN